MELYERYDEVEKLIDQEKFQDAIAALLPMVEEDPTYVLAHLALARVYTKTGQHEEAIAHGVKATEIEPEDAFNFTALSVTFQRAWAGTQKNEYIAAAEDAMARAQMLNGR